MDDEPIDTVGPWTIKSCPTSTRDAVTLAARKEGLTVGQWLTKRVEEWTADGQPVVINQGKPGQTGEMGRIEAVAGAIRELAAAGVPIAKGHAETVTRALLTQLPGYKPPRPRQARLGRPAGET